MNLLTSKKINQWLNEIEGWSYSNSQIAKEFEFTDFKQTLSFVNKVGNTAEEINHHPDIFIHSWNKVKFIISTHSKGGVTENDFILARKIEELNKK